jgi:hypothetical protein
MRCSGSTELGHALVSFFQERLPEQRGLSQHSIRSYRDALVLWLQHIARTTKRGVEKLELSDLTVAKAEQFLTHWDNSRRSSPYRSSAAFDRHQSSIWRVRTWRRYSVGLIDERLRGSGTTLVCRLGFTVRATRFDCVHCGQRRQSIFVPSSTARNWQTLTDRTRLFSRTEQALS